MISSLEKTDTSAATKEDQREIQHRERMNDILKKQGHDKAYTPLESINWEWTIGEVAQFDYLWKEGHAIENIASYLKKEVDDIAIIAFDRARKGKIKPRKNGVFDSFS